MVKKPASAEKKLPLLKPILALPTQGQMWILSELQAFEKGNFDLGHPVVVKINDDVQNFRGFGDGQFTSMVFRLLKPKNIVSFKNPHTICASINMPTYDGKLRQSRPIIKIIKLKMHRK